MGSHFPIEKSKPSNLATVESLWRERLGAQKAAGVTIVTDLVAPDGLVEIMLTAVR